MTALNRESLPPTVAARFDAQTIARLVTLRRAIHADPELSGEEQRTSARLEEALRALPGVEVQRVASNGLVARIRGTAPGAAGTASAVAIRGDIDALPIQEETGLSFASTNPGVMHACGHDVHATWAVGAAMLIARQPAAGDVLIVLQPAEEIGAGALAILESGALDGAGAIVGAHVDRRFPVGTVVVDDGRLAASADSFTISLTGRGAHAARPHEARDVVVALGALIVAVQSIVSRRLDPAIPGVVTIGVVQAGTAPNVIPGSATLRGTIRAVDPVSRALMQEELHAIVDGVCAAHRIEGRVELDRGTPPLVNPSWPASTVRAAAVELLGRDHVVPLGTVNLAGEDFSYYMERMPGCFIRVGAREQGGEVIPAHSPRFFPAEESILVGAAILADGARRIAAELAEHG